jgi:hypothetical protein
MTSLLTDHLPLLVFQAALVAWFLALLWRERGGRRAFFLRVWGSLVAGAAAIAWLMSAGGGRRP